MSSNYPVGYGSGMFGDYTYGGGPTSSTPTTTDTSGGAFSNMDTGDWLNLAGTAAQVYAGTRKGKFTQVPLTPAQQAAQKVALDRYTGRPNYDEAAYPLLFMGAASSPQLDMDKLRAGQSGAYTAPQSLSPTDLTSIIQKNHADNAALSGGAPGATNGGVPPPPPDIPETTHRKRKSAIGILKGAVTGLVGGPIGAIAGGVGGALGAQKQNNADWDKNHADYNAWKAQYGSQFTDASGKAVTPPTTMDDYKKWYQMRYGKPYDPQAAPAQGAAPQHVSIADTVMDWWMKNHYQPPTNPAAVSAGGG